MMNQDQLVMGKNCVYTMDESFVNNNVIIVGGTGSGKTHDVLEPMLLHTYNSSIVVNLNKRILFDKYAPLFLERGYRILDINLSKPNLSNCSFNILEYIKDDSDIRDLANSIVESALGKATSTKDPYWNTAAANLLAFFIKITKANRDYPTFNDVLYLVNKLTIASQALRDKSDVDFEADTEDENIEFIKGLDSIAEKSKNSTEATGYLTYRNNHPSTAACILSTLNSALDAVFTNNTLEALSLSRPILDIDAIGKEKTVLFITTPPLNKSAHIFSNLILSHVFKELFEFAEYKCPTGELPVPVRFLFDDFACGGIVPDFERSISIVRQKRLSVTLLLQDFSQLDSMYGHEKAKTIVNNCDNIVYMGGMDEASVKKISLLVNKPFEEIMYMPLTQVVVIRRGNKGAIITNRYDTDANPAYKKLTTAYELQLANKSSRKKYIDIKF